MKLIAISGLDGSGKSTQINLLKSYLESQGKKVFYFHAIQFGLASKLSKRSNNNTTSIIKANWFQIILRRIFLMIDILRFKSLRKKLENSGYDYILSDRYFYDSVVNIKFLAQSEKTLPCERFIPRPDTATYLQANPENIMARERKPDQGLDYLNRKKDLYDRLAEINDLIIIDGNKTQEKVFEELKNALNKA